MSLDDEWSEIIQMTSCSIIRKHMKSYLEDVLFWNAVHMKILRGVFKKL